MTDVCPELILEEERKWEVAFATVGGGQRVGDNPEINSNEKLCFTVRGEDSHMRGGKQVKSDDSWPNSINNAQKHLSHSESHREAETSNWKTRRQALSHSMICSCNCL